MQITTWVHIEDRITSEYGTIPLGEWLGHELQRLRRPIYTIYKGERYINYFNSHRAAKVFIYDKNRELTSITVTGGKRSNNKDEYVIRKKNMHTYLDSWGTKNAIFGEMKEAG